MKHLASDLAVIGSGIGSRITRLGGLLRRASPGASLVRFTAGAATFVGLAVALPSLDARVGLAFVLPAAVAVALFPRTWIVSLVLVAAVVAWVATTIVHERHLSPWRLAVLALALYLAHAAVGLAAVLPYDAVVAPAVLARWAARSGMVAIASVGAAMLAFLALSMLPPFPTMAGPIVGSLVAAALAGLLAWLAHRR